jgi:hypothetical protein
VERTAVSSRHWAVPSSTAQAAQCPIRTGILLSPHPAANPQPQPNPTPSGATRMPPSGGVVTKTEQIVLPAFRFHVAAYNSQACFAGGPTGPIPAAVRTSARAPRSCRAPRIEPSLPGRLPHQLDLRLKRCARSCRAACVGKLLRSGLASGFCLARHHRAQECATRVSVLRTIFWRDCATEKADSIGANCGVTNARSGGLRGASR